MKIFSSVLLLLRRPWPQLSIQLSVSLKTCIALAITRLSGLGNHSQ